MYVSSMTLLDYNSNGDVIGYADVQLYCSYISAALTNGVFLQHKLRDAHRGFLRSDFNRAHSLVIIKCSSILSIFDTIITLPF